MASTGRDEHSNDAALIDQPLFRGIVFWLSATVPTRQSMIDKIEANGGTVTKRESDATVKIADHLKAKHAPDGSLSYTFIDASLRSAELADLDPHRIGPVDAGARPVAAVSHPSKHTRSAYTADDDAFLWAFVRDHGESLTKNTVAGNELYKQLERINPRHPWQSWRDRYVKKFRNQPLIPKNVQVERPTTRDSTSTPETTAGPTTGAVLKPGTPQPQTTLAENESLDGDLTQAIGIVRTTVTTVPTSELQLKAYESLFIRPQQDDGGSNVELTDQESIVTSPSTNFAGFTGDDYRILLDAADSIYGIDPARYEEAWEALAEQLPHHTATEWKRLWESEVRHQYLQDQAKRLLESSSSDIESSDEISGANSLRLSEPLYEQGREAAQANEWTSTDGSEEDSFISSAQLFETSRPSLSAGPENTSRKRKRGREHAIPGEDRSSPGSESSKRPRAESAQSLRSGGTHISYDKKAAHSIRDKRSSKSSSDDSAEFLSLDDEPELDKPDSNFHGVSNTDSSQVAIHEGNEDWKESLQDADDVVAEQIEELAGRSKSPQHDEDGQESSDIAPAVTYIQQSDSESEAGFEDTIYVNQAGQEPPDARSTVHEDPHPPSRSPSSPSHNDAQLSTSLAKHRRDFDPAALRTASPPLPAQSQATVLRGLLNSSTDTSSPGNNDESLDENDEVQLGLSPLLGQLTEKSFPVPEYHSEELYAWEENHLDDGVAEEVISQAIKSTGGNIWIADNVIRSIQAGLGVPRRIRGIWTEDDDEVLSANPRNEVLLRGLADKHGLKAVRERHAFLLAQEGTD